MIAVPNCFRCDWQLAERAFSRAWANTGKRIAARMAMIAITTSSSIRVKPFRRFIMSPLVLEGHPELWVAVQRVFLVPLGMAVEEGDVGAVVVAVLPVSSRVGLAAVGHGRVTRVAAAHGGGLRDQVIQPLGQVDARWVGLLAD